MSRKVGLGISLVLISLIMLAVPIRAKDSSYKVKEYNKNNSNLQIIEEFKMPQLNRTRRIWIYLPPDYHQTDKRYPVLYMNDGQNLFNPEANYGGWKVDKSLEKLFAQDKTEGVIIVGIDNGRDYRGEEYEFVIRPRYPSPVTKTQGKQYVNFLINTLKPYIDEHYRTLKDREHTGIAGSSAGARISLYAGFSRPEVFSKVAAFSVVHKYIPLVFKEKIKFKKTQPMKVYLDIGTKEFNGKRGLVENAKDVYQLLREMGFAPEELKVVLDGGAKHTERVWAERFPPVFLWLFEKDKVNFKKYVSGARVYQLETMRRKKNED